MLDHNKYNVGATLWNSLFLGPITLTSTVYRLFYLIIDISYVTYSSPLHKLTAQTLHMLINVFEQQVIA